MQNIISNASHLIYPLSWAIVHSLWQGLLVYLVLRVVLHAIPTVYANTRYYLSTGALMLIAGLFTATYFYYYQQPLNITYKPALSTGSETNAATTYQATATSWWQDLSSWYNSHTIEIAYIYVIGLAILIIRMMMQVAALYRLKSKNIAIPGDNWLGVLNDCKRTLKIYRPIRLYFSKEVTVPVMMGVLKPVVLIPLSLSTQLSMQQAEAILLHELAHIKRHDFLINIIQMCIETVLFFNPFSWLVSALIRKEREHCCDDMVVTATGSLSYAKTLATLETYRQMPQVALAAKSSKQHLLIRIKRIMEMKDNNINFSQLIAVVLVILFSVTALTFITPEVQAQPRKDKKDKKEQTGEVIITDDNNQTDTSKKKVVTKETIIETDDDNGSSQQKKTSRKIEISGNDINEAEDVLALLEDLDIKQTIADALEEVDWNEIREDIQEAMQESRAALQEAKEAMGEMPEINDSVFAKAQKEIEAAQQQIIEAKREMAEARKEQVHAMAEARKEMAEAREEMMIAQKKARSKQREISSRYDNILVKMEKDGLINRKKRYKVEKDGNDLYIDGIKQSTEVFKKYGKMFNHRNVTIKGSANSINIKAED